MSWATSSFAGHVVRKPSIKEVNGKPTCKVTIGCTRKFKRNGEACEDHQFISVDLWDDRAQAAAKYLEKGQPVILSGWPTTRVYQARDQSWKAEIVLANPQWVFCPLPPRAAAPEEQLPEDQQPTSRPGPAPAAADDEPPF